MYSRFDPNFYTYDTQFHIKLKLCGTAFIVYDLV
jgi:hypothetical protein